MKEYTRDELIGNILICREGESYIIKLPSSNLPNKVNLNRIERDYILQNYEIRHINISINENGWIILPSEGIKNNYEIY